MPTTTTPSRLPLRVPPHIRQRAERAAELRGLSLNALIVYAVAEVSEHIIQDEHLVRLTEKGTRKFRQLMAQPPAPNAALTKAASTHRRIRRA